MFPIYDVAGHVVGFGGRVLDDREPKYLNSAESELFAKRTLLYGLNWAKQSIRKADRLIVVEGYFDADSPARSPESPRSSRRSAPRSPSSRPR